MRKFLVESIGYVQGLLLCMAVLLVAACGGGSGDDAGDGGGIVDTSQPLSVASSNAVPVSGLVVDAATGGITAGSVGTIFIAASDALPATRVSVDLSGLTQDVIDRLWSMRLQGTLGMASVGPAQVPPSVDCEVSGTVSATWNDVDMDNELSVGDYILLNFNNCVESGLTLNGGMDVGVLELTGDPYSDAVWTVVLRLNFNTLTAAEGGAVVEVVGSLDAMVDSQASGSLVTTLTTEVSVGSGSVASSFLYFGEGEDFTELTVYHVSLQENTDSSFTLTGEGTLESSFIGGTVTFETTQAFSGTDFENNDPAAGQMLILGAANAGIRLRVINSVVVELDVDDEGDGFDGGDATITSSWDELGSAVDAL
jgi:hypothetical protein